MCLLPLVKLVFRPGLSLENCYTHKASNIAQVVGQFLTGSLSWLYSMYKDCHTSVSPSSYQKKVKFCNFCTLSHEFSWESTQSQLHFGNRCWRSIQMLWTGGLLLFLEMWKRTCDTEFLHGPIFSQA